MKRLFATLLALCLLLASGSFAAEDVSGNWYMTFADVTVGYIYLNEDGTAVANISNEMDSTGTWSFDGSTVTVTIEGSPMDLAYDGTALTTDILPINFTREEGKLPLAFVQKAISGEDVELPEGMTEEDLMAFAMNFFQEFAALMSSESDPGSETTEPAPAEEATEAPAEPEETAAPAEEPTEAPAEPAPSADTGLTTVKSSFITLQGYSAMKGVYMAEVKNDTDAGFYIVNGALTLKDADGNEVGSQKYFAQTGSRYLAPGETTFVSISADIAEGAEVKDYEVEIIPEANHYSGEDKVIDVDAAELTVDQYNNVQIQVTVTNNTDEALPYISVVYAAEDAEGNIVYVGSEGLYRYLLGAHSTLTFVSSLTTEMEKYLEENGLTLVSAEAFAFAENK